MATVVVTDGEQRSALAVVRSLGAAGHRCIVLSASGRSLAGASRHAAVEYRAPDPSASPVEFASRVRDLVLEARADIVIPISEPAILSLLPRRDEIRAVIPMPDLSTFEAVSDKDHVLAVAAANGIRVPRQQVLRTRSDAAALDTPFPLVLKPVRSVFTAPDGTRSKTAVTWADSRAALDAALDVYPDAAFPILAQEAITGHGTGIFVLLHDDDVLARFSHRRIREKPPRGGVSVVCRSEPMDESLYERTLAMLRALNWSGVAMAEYKRDAVTGEAVLMEINGRFWGSLQLAIDAGVDFPRLLVDAALGRRPAPVLEYGDAGCRWEWGHVDHVIACWRTPIEGQGRMRALLDWFRLSGSGYHGEVLRARDRRPFYRETAQWFGSLIGR